MRSSNIEICRIAAILLVVLTHSASWSQGNLDSIDTCFVPALFIRGFSVIGVNVFVFITGWFGVNYKRSSLINLLFIVLFWGIARAAILWYQGTLVWRNLFVLSDTNWFVISYLGLLLFSQVINIFIENSTQKNLKLFLLSFLIYQTWFGWFPALPYFDTFQMGYSFVSFIFIYMTARCLKKYGIPSFLHEHSFLIFIVISLVLGFAAYFSVLSSISITGFIYRYNNPLVILSAIAFFLTFHKLRVPNIKWVNYVATSTLSVLLIHEPYPAHAFIKQQFVWLRDNSVMGGGKLMIYWILSVLFVFVVSVCLDQIRIFAYKPIKRYLELHNDKQGN